MLVTLLGIVTLVRPVQSGERTVPDAGDAVGDRDASQAGAIQKALFPMLVTLLGIVTLVRLLQFPNALLPMLVTVLPMVTLVRFDRLENTLSMRLITGRPLIVSGIFTAPPKPVYPVMVIVPLLVV